MKRIKLLAAVLIAAATTMAQTTKKSFTLNDLLGGGSTFWNLQPKYMFSTWWGERPVELTVEDAKIIGSEKSTLFTCNDINAVLGEKILRSCTSVTFPYADQSIVKIQTNKEIIVKEESCHFIQQTGHNDQKKCEDNCHRPVYIRHGCKEQ